jgi:hypothetical protein
MLSCKLQVLVCLSCNSKLVTEWKHTYLSFYHQHIIKHVKYLNVLHWDSGYNSSGESLNVQTELLKSDVWGPSLASTLPGVSARLVSVFLCTMNPWCLCLVACMWTFSPAHHDFFSCLKLFLEDRHVSCFVFSAIFSSVFSRVPACLYLTGHKDR